MTETDPQQTLLLSKVIGLFLVIVGVAILFRRHYLASVFVTIADERLTRGVLALIELLAGLFLVVMHNEWSSLPAGIISFIGWMAVAESVSYLLLPDRVINPFIRAINTPGWYFFGGMLAIALGLYLAAHGFALF